MDREHDDADLGRRRIGCPLLVLWSADGALPRFYGDVLTVSEPWAHQVHGHGPPGSHLLVEDQPVLVADALSVLLENEDVAW